MPPWRNDPSRALLRTAAVLAASVIVLAGCREDGAQAPPSAAIGAGCAPVAGDGLVVLTDDKGLQGADNIIPAINKKASSPELIAALDRVSAALDTTKLVELNRAVVIGHKSSRAAARDFATANHLTTGLTEGKGGAITVGTANFSRNATLGELYGIVLTAAGYTVEVRRIGNRERYEPALERGDITVVPEYAATLATFLAGKVDDSDLDTTVTNLTALGGKRGLVFGKPSRAQDQNAFAVTAAFAEKYALTSLSDLASKCSGTATVLGGPAECPQRPRCQQGLVSVYNFQAGKFDTLDAGGPLTENGLKTGAISVGLVLSSDSAPAAG